MLVILRKYNGSYSVFVQINEHEKELVFTTKDFVEANKKCRELEKKYKKETKIKN